LHVGGDLRDLFVSDAEVGGEDVKDGVVVVEVCDCEAGREGKEDVCIASS
jgi:hypothetical protein